MNKCEWCGMVYPKGTYDYYKITVWKKEHIICKDCYKQLKQI